MAEGEIRIADMTASSGLTSDDNFVVDKAGSNGTKKFPAADYIANKEELVDIRVGPDGVTYPSAGDAVRRNGKECIDLMNVVTGFDNGINIYNPQSNVSNKYWTYTGGSGTDSAWCVSGYMPVQEGLIYSYSGLTATGQAPHTLFFDENYNFVKAYKQLVGSNQVTAPSGAKYVSFSIKLTDANNFKFIAPINFATKNDIYQLLDTRPTYVILDFDNDIESLNDNRVTLVKEQYNYNFSFVGISEPEITKELIKMGCDLSIYSSNPNYLPPVSTINSTAPEDLEAWDTYVNEVLTRYNNAGFYNQVCWSCQGMNFGTALETALRKYGFKMARGNEVGGTKSIYIDSFDDSSFKIGCFQIYSDHPALALQQVTNAVNGHKDICIFTHKIVDDASQDRGYDCTKEAYTTFLNGLKTKEETGQIKVVTLREYYKMHCPKSNYEYDYNRIFKTIWHNN